MANSPVLGLENIDTASTPRSYTRDLEDDRQENANFNKVDAFSGLVSASFSSEFFLSGTVSNNLSSDVGSEYSKTDRVITDVVAWAARSGSGGVTRIDVQRQQDGVGAAFVSIYSNNAFKPAVSASLGNYGVALGGTISGSIWKAGTFLKVVFDTAANVQADINVQVFYRPSGSYGA